MNWKIKAIEVVRSAITEGQALGLTGQELKAFIAKAYPFGERKHTPYKIWSDELNRQLTLADKAYRVEMMNKELAKRGFQ